jgi:hypothetical protein
MTKNSTSRAVACALALMAIQLLPLRAQEERVPQCKIAGPASGLPDVHEASGVAVSRKDPGRIWVHNDSGQPVLFAANERGAVRGQIRLTGIAIEDWEATSIAPCPNGSCLYIGDIGDNSATRKSITVYRAPEPDGAADSLAVQEAFHATYPDGPHDAETLLVTPRGEMFVVTKGDKGPVALYRFPRDARPGSTVVLERVGGPRSPGKSRGDERITDGAVSPNGEWVVLRSHQALYFYDASSFLSGKWSEAGRVSLEALREPQGEGVAFAGDTTLYLVGEGGKSKAGTIARVTCSL